MGDQRFTGAAGLAGFSQVVRESLVPQTITVGDPAAFQARMTDVEIGRLRLVSAALDPIRAQRTAAATTAAAGVFLLLSLRAQGEIRHRHGHEAIVPGRLVVVPGAEEFTVEHASAARVIFVVLPEPVVTARYPLLDGPIRSAAVEPVAAALIRQLPHLMSAAEHAGTAGQPDELSGILDALLHLTLRRTIGDTTGQPLLALRVAVERLVEQELARPDGAPPQLGVSDLAARLAVSVRQLHRAFESSGGTVADYVRQRRLAACARALRESSATVTELAHRYGFSSASHLGVLFRQRYGTSPGQWRAADRDPAPR
ncbi:AraC family transcriptional regulator [Solwaraspora sp. WMMA2101]|uniref:helix-turn-helix transcriptional regulator n=1 Tax=Solwaraspora sp. WMMA2101 TaxID=3404124 RepID=UPI003B95DFE6